MCVCDRFWIKWEFQTTGPPPSTFFRGDFVTTEGSAGWWAFFAFRWMIRVCLCALFLISSSSYRMGLWSISTQEDQQSTQRIQKWTHATNTTCLYLPCISGIMVRLLKIVPAISKWNSAGENTKVPPSNKSTVILSSTAHTNNRLNIWTDYLWRCQLRCHERPWRHPLRGWCWGWP